MNWRLRLSLPRVERPRQTRHAATSGTPPPKLTAVELWVKALVQNQPLALSHLAGEEASQNVTITATLEEIPDTPDGFFEDTSTWRLHIRFESFVLGRALDVLFDEFSGTKTSQLAPTWLRDLAPVLKQSAQFTRHYLWVGGRLV
ncbi:hypothetical protein C8Q77DRAFT_1159063 [Trametes polyzona]|nr:hypothetical protein C8Q77DRAFT_1159063 [Trametes polyzona]